MFQHRWSSTTVGMDMSFPGERRGCSRITIPYSARIRGIDISGQTFRQDVVIDNLSTSGAYFRLKQCVALGTRLTIIVTLSQRSSAGASESMMVVRGSVVRIEPQPGGGYGVAVSFAKPSAP
jgi:PilZ domain